MNTLKCVYLAYYSFGGQNPHTIQYTLYDADGATVAGGTLSSYGVDPQIERSYVDSGRYTMKLRRTAGDSSSDSVGLRLWYSTGSYL